MREELREALVQSVLCGEDFDKITEKASQYLNNPVVIINNAYNIIAHSKLIQVEDITWNNAVKRGYITLEFAATLNNWNNIKDENRKYECLTVNKINNLRRRFYKLIINSQFMGYMNVTEVNGTFDDIDEDCYYFASQIFAKEIFIQQKNIPHSKHTRNEDILMELTSSNYVNRLHFVDHVQLSELNIKSQYRVVCSDLINFLSYNADEDYFKQELLSFFPSGTIIIMGKILIILIDVKHHSYTDFNCEKKLDKYLKSKKLTLGISDLFHDLFEFKRYETQAIKAYENKSSLLNDSLNYVFYEEVKSYDLLQQISKDDLIYFCNQKVWKLYEYDKTYGTDYLNTLHVYLNANHSIKITSSYLYLHRNTINYRIQKIKELFEIDLDDYTMLNQLLMSCHIVKVWSSKWGTD
ncbi:MAG: helix-turn-helix domain-containing protein [Clostridium sp.]